MKKLNFYLTQPEYQRLTELSKKTGMKMGEIIRRALDEYLAILRDRL